MKYYEIATGYTPVPARMGAATEIVVEELVKSLEAKGHDVTLVDIKCNDRPDNPYKILEVNVPKKFQSTDVSLGIAHKFKRVIYSIGLASTLKKEIKRNKEEEVFLHFHNQYNLFFFLILTSKKLRKNAKIIYTNHSYIWHGEWSEIESSVRKKYFQEIYSMRNADFVYVLNDKALYNITNHVGGLKGRIALINNGVNTNVYKTLPESEVNEIKGKYGLNGKRVFIQIGSVCDRKNQLGAIKLLEPLMKSNGDIVFCYAGGIISAEYQAEIKDYSRENGIEDRVIYLGELHPGEELNEVYNMAEAMIFPSKAEGFSLVILEAMAAGIPVVINKSLKFAVADYCLQYDDKSEFEGLIKGRVFDKTEREDLVKKALEVINKNYSWDAIAEEYLRIHE